MSTKNISTKPGQWCLRGQEIFARVCIDLRGATFKVKNANQKGGDLWSR